MLSQLYAKWMVSWETALTTRDTNRIVRPLEWGFDWLPGFDAEAAGSDDLNRMIAANQEIVARSGFFAYRTPTDFRLEQRHPQLFPTNVRPETLAQDADWKHRASTGELSTEPFLPCHLARQHTLPGE